MGKASLTTPAAALTGTELLFVTQEGETLVTTPLAIATYVFSGYGANTFPARASTGALSAKPISDLALSLLDDATQAQMRSTIGAGVGTVTSVGVADATGITWTGGPVTNSGTLTPTLAANLRSLAGLAVGGLTTRLGDGSFVGRTLTGTAGRITVTNGDGNVGNPTVDIPTTLVNSGTYTPTLTNTTNIASSTASSAQWSRTGNTVTVSGNLSVTATAAAATLTTLGISLPVASALANSNELGGTGALINAPATIFGDATNDRATVQWLSASTGALTLCFHFTYRVI
jgi:hypothetical protein